jgi:glycosyltransferase involved in cell wall biosynthesis
VFAVLLSVVVPCYNEEESIPALLDALDASDKELQALGHTLEVIVVDDGSRDRSPELLCAATATRPYLRVLRFARNFGQTAAMAAGFESARGEVIFPMDADLQNDPADIPRLLAKLEEGYDVVSGWREERQDAAISRKLPSTLANRLISWVSGVHLHDYGCTLKAYRREVLSGVRLYGEMHRFIPIYAASRGARVTELPVRHHPRRAGTSKYGLNRIPNVILDLFLVRFLWVYGTKPIHLFGKFGLASIALSFVTFLLMLYFKFWGGKPFVETPLPLVCVMFFLIGCVTILMGLLAELLMRTYHEAAHIPTFVVREEYRGGERLKSAAGAG